MTRLRRIADHDRIFFITVRVGRGVGLLSPAERDIVLQYVAAERSKGTFLIFGYVVMPDHLHLLIAPFQAGLQDESSLEDENRTTDSHITWEHGAFWQARYFDFILRRVGDFWEKLQYIHHNPVEAKLVASPEEWPWSSAAYYAKKCGSDTIDTIDLPPERNALLWPAPWR